MALFHVVLTLSGVPQTLLSAVQAGAPTGEAADISLRAITLQPGGANANPVYVGGSSPNPATPSVAPAAITSANHAFSLPASAAGVPAAPFVLGEFSNSGPLKPSNFVVLGTLNETLKIGFIPF